MKRLLILLFLSVMLIKVSAQSTMTVSDYLKKSRQQKTAGWILVGSGTAMIVVGGSFALLSKSLDFYDDRSLYNMGIVMFSLGVISTSTGVYFFIQSAKSRKKAGDIAVGLKMENSSYVHNNALGRTSYPAIGLSVSL